MPASSSSAAISLAGVGTTTMVVGSSRDFQSWRNIYRSKFSAFMHPTPLIRNDDDGQRRSLQTHVYISVAGLKWNHEIKGGKSLLLLRTKTRFALKSLATSQNRT